MSEREQVQQALQMRAGAYGQLLSGSESLLEGESLYWGEKALLTLLRELSRRRLQQPRKSMIEAMAEAALGGHELGQWEAVESGIRP